MFRTGKKPLHVRFSAAPPIGTTFTVHGRDYEITKAIPWVRRDGDETTLITWVGHCVSCGIDYEQTTGRSFTSFKQRCEDCRKTFMAERKAKASARR